MVISWTHPPTNGQIAVRRKTKPSCRRSRKPSKYSLSEKCHHQCYYLFCRKNDIQPSNEKIMFGRCSQQPVLYMVIVIVVNDKIIIISILIMKILTKILPQTVQNVNYLLNYAKLLPNLVISLPFRYWQTSNWGSLFLSNISQKLPVGLRLW